MPFSTKAFDRLGVREKLDRTFLPKHGGEILSACGVRGVKFYFKDGYRAERDRAYQVTRSEFDQLLLDHSRENGAEVREETSVTNITLAKDRVRLEIAPLEGEASTLEARYLLDCSGRQTVIGNFLKLKHTYDHLQKFSVFSHYENVDRAEGIDGTLIRMVRGLDRWFWMIPLTPTRMSIGVVMDTATFRAMKLSPEAALEKCLGEQPLILERMTRAERVAPVYSAGDYSYRNTQLYGDRWILAGDAAGFIDPVFSSGVFLAIMSAEKAADALDEVLRDESREGRALQDILPPGQSRDGHVSAFRDRLVQRQGIHGSLHEPHGYVATRTGRECGAGGTRVREFRRPMEDVVVLFLGGSAALLCLLAAALTRAEGTDGCSKPARNCHVLVVTSLLSPALTEPCS